MYYVQCAVPFYFIYQGTLTFPLPPLAQSLYILYIARPLSPPLNNARQPVGAVCLSLCSSCVREALLLVSSSPLSLPSSREEKEAGLYGPVVCCDGRVYIHLRCSFILGVHTLRLSPPPFSVGFFLVPNRLFPRLFQSPTNNLPY